MTTVPATSMVAEQWTCTVHSDIADVLAAEWNSVIDVAGAPFFYRHEFLTSLQMHPLYEIEDACYFVVGDGGSPIAVLPIYRVSWASPLTGDGGTTTGAAEWVTHLPHWYDSWFPAAVDVRRLVEPLRGWLGDLGIPAVTFQNVGAPHLLAAFRATGHEPVAQDTRYTMQLTNHSSYEAWLQSRGSSTRRTLRRAESRARARGWHRCVSDDTSEPDRIVDLCRLSTAKHDNDGWLPREITAAFVRSLPAGSVVVHRVTNNSGTVAGAFGFVDRSTYHSWSGGVDPTMLEDGAVDANALLYISEIAFGFDRGLTFFEGGRRSAEIKSRLGMSAAMLHGVRVTAR